MENEKWLNCQQSNAIDVDTNGYLESKTQSGVPNAEAPTGIKKDGNKRQKTYQEEHDYVCKYCGVLFHRRGKKKNRVKYCSLQCKYEGSKNNTYHYIPPKTGQYFTCKNCGKQFYRHPSEIAKKRTNYCSFACRKQAKYNPYSKGDKCPQWKGGRTLLAGYVYLKSYNHPFKNCDEYVAEHRLVMERHIGRYLYPYENVHHKNGVKTDNRIENLEIVTHNTHYGNVTCPYCNNTFKVK